MQNNEVTQPSPMELSARSFHHRDIISLVGWFNTDRDVKEWGGPGLTLSGLRDQLEEIADGKSKWCAFSVDADRQGPVGHFQIAYEPVLKTAVLGRLGFAPVCRGLGAGAALAQMAVREGFETPAHRLELRVYTFNTAAIRVYEKIGFLSEGVCREASPFQDTFWDVQIMSLLRPEWLEQRQKEPSQ